jgi:hypothetical protein
LFLETKVIKPFLTDHSLYNSVYKNSLFASVGQFWAVKQTWPMKTKLCIVIWPLNCISYVTASQTLVIAICKEVCICSQLPDRVTAWVQSGYGCEKRGTVRQFSSNVKSRNDLKSAYSNYLEWLKKDKP